MLSIDKCLQSNFYAFEQNFWKQRRYPNKTIKLRKMDQDIKTQSNKKADKNDFLYQAIVNFIFSYFCLIKKYPQW